MVYVPILKIDLPEPRLQELIPGTVHAVLSCCTAVFDAVHDYLRPLSPEQEVILYTQAVSHLPREFRQARKRIVEKNIRDEDKMSEELEDASFAYYRRRMREELAGFSDEDTEDVTFRRLMNSGSVTRQLFGPGPLERPPDADAAAADAAAAAAAAAQAQHLPGRARRVTVTTVAGASGLALGAGVLKLAQLVRRLRGGKRKPKGRRAAQQAAGGRRRRGSEQGSSGGGGGSKAGTRTRTVPRQR